MSIRLSLGCALGVIAICVARFSVAQYQQPAVANSPVGTLAADDQGEESVILQRLAGSGGWRTQGSPEQQNRPWRLHAVRAKDGSVRAKLSVLGVPGFEDVTVEGQIIERDAFGVLLDGKGQQVATFNAKLAADGNGGSFILGNGESGTWDYDERTKAELSTADVRPAKVE